MNTSIAFVGGGNMASSLIGGMIAEHFEAGQILVAEPDADTRKNLQERFRVRTTNNNSEIVDSDIVILAVKPQQLQSACRQLALTSEEKKSDSHSLFISIAAGIRSSDIDRWLGGNNAVIRCMPNTPSLFQAGATALYSNNKTSRSQKQLAETIMASVGIAVWVENENNLDAVTALSGSGPAYFFLLMEAMQLAGKELGLDDKVAEKLAIQTALGAAKMAKESHEELTGLREKVTSKGGTTEKAIQHFENSKFKQLVKAAMQAACDRSIALADELAKDD